jgi:hypothetical protein
VQPGKPTVSAFPKIVINASLTGNVWQASAEIIEGGTGLSENGANLYKVNAIIKSPGSKLTRWKS